MATYINVAIGDGGLLSQVKAQQQAGRFSHEEQRRQRTIQEQKESVERDKDPYWRSIKPTEKKRELTAHRHPGGSSWAWSFSQAQPAVTTAGNFITIQGSLDDKQIKSGTRTLSVDSIAACGSPDGRAWQLKTSKYQYGSLPTGGFTYICDYVLGTTPVSYGSRRGRAFDSNGASSAVIAIPAGNGTGVVVGVRAIKAVYADITGYFTYVPGADVGMEFRGIATPTEPVDNPSKDFSFHDNSTREYFAYFVAKGIVRQLAVPATLQAALDILSPPPTYATKTFRLNFTDHTYLSPEYSAGTRPPANGVFVGLGGEHRTATPDLFRYINDIAPFTAAPLLSAADWIAAGNIPVVANATVGGYKRIWDATTLADFYASCPAGERLSVHKWLNATTPGQPWDAATFAPTAKWRTAFPRQARTLSSVMPNFNVASPCTGVMDEFWDWGDPAYCQTQLLALGFSAADIKP